MIVVLREGLEHLCQDVCTVLVADGCPCACRCVVQFSHETGHGLGPTVEFYTLVCREVQRASLNLWRNHREKHSTAVTSAAAPVAAADVKADADAVHTPDAHDFVSAPNVSPRVVPAWWLWLWRGRRVHAW